MSTSAVPRALARIVAGAVISAVVAVALAAPAGASEPIAPPPSAVAAPATTSVPAAGDAGQNYWATDSCHYFAQGGQWHSDMCRLAFQDASGNTIPHVFGNFQNLGDGKFGRELIRLSFEFPGYLAFSAVTPQLTFGPWYRVPVSDPSRIESLGKTQAGDPIWVSVPMPTNGGSPTGSDGYINSPAQAQHWAQQAQVNQAIADTWSLAAGFRRIYP